jgi:hypothetical protein
VIKFGNTTYAQTRTAAENNADKYLDQMTGPELVELYRLIKSNLGEEVRTTRFSDSATGIKRTWEALQAFDAASDESLGAADKGKVELTDADKKQIKDEAADRKATQPKTRKPRGMRFVFPAGDEIKSVRPGTFRAKLVELFSTGKGATFDEAMAATWGSKKGMDEETAKKTTYEGIRLLHYYVGYGMKQDAEGRITIHK